MAVFASCKAQATKIYVISCTKSRIQGGRPPLYFRWLDGWCLDGFLRNEVCSSLVIVSSNTMVSDLNFKYNVTWCNTYYWRVNVFVKRCVHYKTLCLMVFSVDYNTIHVSHYWLLIIGWFVCKYKVLISLFRELTIVYYVSITTIITIVNIFHFLRVKKIKVIKNKMIR